MISVPVVRLAGPVIFLILFGTFPHSAGGDSRIKTGNTVPWERQYKIKPSEKARLTPPEGVPKRTADVLGPDNPFDLFRVTLFVLPRGKKPLERLAYATELPFRKPFVETSPLPHVPVLHCRKSPLRQEPD
jgi:hypothetical protein